MDWFYTQMLQLHIVLAWCSLGLFVARGLAAQLGSDWATDARVMVFVFGCNALLAITGLSLWNLLNFNPMRDSWLMAKLLALAGYFICGHWAMGRGEFRVIGYAVALLMMAYMMAVSMTRQAGLGLF